MDLSRQAKRMLQVILIIGVAALLLAVLYYRSKAVLPFLYGLLIGVISSVLRVFVLEHVVNKAIAAAQEKSPTYSIYASQIFRLALVAVALLLGALVETISLLGVVVGVFAYQVAVYFLKSTLNDEQKAQLRVNRDNTAKEDDS